MVDWAEATSFGDRLLVGLIVWVGFVATTIAVNGIFAGRTWRPCHRQRHLVSLLGLGVILAVWDWLEEPARLSPSLASLHQWEGARVT